LRFLPPPGAFGEGLYRAQHLAAEMLGILERDGGDTLRQAVDAILLGACLRLDKAAGNQQQGGARLDGSEAGVMGRVREQAKRKAVGRELGHTMAVFEQSGSMSGIDVGQGSEFLLVAAEKGGRAPYSSRGLNNEAIQLNQ